MITEALTNFFCSIGIYRIIFIAVVIIFTPYKFNLFCYYFCHPTPLTIVAVIVAHLQSAFQRYLLAFVGSTAQ